MAYTSGPYRFISFPSGTSAKISLLNGTGGEDKISIRMLHRICTPLKESELEFGALASGVVDEDVDEDVDSNDLVEETGTKRKRKKAKHQRRKAVSKKREKLPVVELTMQSRENVTDDQIIPRRSDRLAKQNKRVDAKIFCILYNSGL
jgi:hypothetical protein